MKFRFVDSGANTGFLNMALDEATMDFVRMGKTLPTIRLYQWRPSCLSLGYFQILSEINVVNCNAHGINVVRRLTGGKAVLHNKELTYSFIAPQTFLPGSITESYKIIANPILNTLQQLGLNVSLISKRFDKTSSPFCFYDSSYYEINVNKKKIVGSAQARIKNIFLQHGSILLDFDPDMICLLFNTKNNNVDKKVISERVTSIKQEIQKDIKLSRIKSLLIENFQKLLNIEIVEDKLTEDELLFAKKIEEKYKDV